MSYSRLIRNIFNLCESRATSQLFVASAIQIIGIDNQPKSDTSNRKSLNWIIDARPASHFPRIRYPSWNRIAAENYLSHVYDAPIRRTNLRRGSVEDFVRSGN